MAVAEKNKFQKMIEQNSKRKRAVSSDAKLEKEAKKESEKLLKARLSEYKQHDPASYKKAVSIAKRTHTKIIYYIGLDLSAYDKNGNLLENPTEETNIAVTTGAINDPENQEEPKTIYQDSPIDIAKSLEKQQSEIVEAERKEREKLEQEKREKERLEQEKREQEERFKKAIEESIAEEIASQSSATGEISINAPEGSNFSINLDIGDAQGSTSVVLDTGDADANISMTASGDGAEISVSGNGEDENKENSDSDKFGEKEQTLQEEIPFEDTIDMSEFEGMTDEEIAVEIDRRKRLAMLKQKYSEDAKAQNDPGGYKKSLDFALNRDLKRFKMKPPKIAIILPIICVVLAIAIGITTTVLVLNKEAPPATLISAEISQKTTYHYVGDEVDLRGIYIEEVYSDGSKQTIPVSASMISNHSSNIANNLVVNALASNSFIEFTYNGKTQRLTVVLNEKQIDYIDTFEIYQSEINSYSTIKFENILVMARIIDIYDDYIGLKRLSPSSATFVLDDSTELETNQIGILLNGVESGTHTITIKFIENLKLFEKSFQITVA